MFVERIRASDEFVPELALVAEDDSGVIGHVMLSWVGLESTLQSTDPQPDADVGAAGPAAFRRGLAPDPRSCSAARKLPASLRSWSKGFPPTTRASASSAQAALGFIAPHPKIPDDAFMVKRLAGYEPGLGGPHRLPARRSTCLGYAVAIEGKPREQLSGGRERLSPPVRAAGRHPPRARSGASGGRGELGFQIAGLGISASRYPHRREHGLLRRFVLSPERQRADAVPAGQAGRGCASVSYEHPDHVVKLASNQGPFGPFAAARASLSAAGPT